MFGNKDAAPDTGEIARLNGLPVRDLAVEVMTRGFGATLEPSWTGRPATSAVDAVVTVLVPGASKLPATEYRELYDVIGEGVQQLEHASLVRLTYLDNIGGRLFVITRLGRAALSDGSVSQHV